MFLCIILAATVVYYFIDAAIARYKPRFGQATGIIIIIGAVFSGIYFALHGETQEDLSEFQFRPTIYWNMLVPPLIVNGAYHLPREKFLFNFGNIFIMGILVTVSCFVINILGL